MVLKLSLCIMLVGTTNVLQRAISVSARRDAEFYNSSSEVVKDVFDGAKLLVGGIPHPVLVPSTHIH